MYLVSTIVALAALPGNLISAWAVERVGRRITLCLSMALSGVSVFAITAITDTAGVAAFSCAFSALTVGGWNALDLLSAETFDTRYGLQDLQ